MKQSTKLVLMFILVVISAFGSYFILSYQALGFKEKVMFENTNFTWTVNNPTQLQVSEISELNGVESYLGVYSFGIDVRHQSQTIRNASLQLRNEEAPLGLSLASEGTLIEGSLEGLVIDLYLAEQYNLNIGDDIEFTLLGQSISQTITGIIHQSNYPMYDEGVIYGVWTEALAERLVIDGFDLLYVQTSNNTDINAYLSEYKPLGRMMTEETYRENFIRTNPIPNENIETWEALLASSYEDYVANFLEQDYSSSYQSKDLISTDFILRAEDYLNQASLFRIIHLASMILLSFALTIIIFKQEEDNNIQRNLDGESISKLLTEYLFKSFIWIIVPVLITIGVAYQFTEQSFMSSDYFYSASLDVSVMLLSLLYIPIGFSKINKINNQQNSKTQLSKSSDNKGAIPAEVLRIDFDINYVTEEFIPSIIIKKQSELYLKIPTRKNHAFLGWSPVQSQDAIAFKFEMDNLYEVKKNNRYKKVKPKSKSLDIFEFARKHGNLYMKIKKPNQSVKLYAIWKIYQ